MTVYILPLITMVVGIHTSLSAEMSLQHCWNLTSCHFAQSEVYFVVVRDILGKNRGMLEIVSMR